MKIFLLSMTDNLDGSLKEALKGEIILHGNKIAYISSTKQEGERKYYASTISDYRAISENISVDYFDLSSDFSDTDLEKLLDYKIIYLSGGNTYAFLKDAKERNLKNILERATKQGALLIGASAGAIMMTPTIDVCSLEDENAVNLSDTSGFGFVDFEFSPHFKESDGALLLSYKKDRDIYLCKDGDGIFCDDGEINLFGEITKI
jgi:dipeptidase E